MLKVTSKGGMGIFFQTIHPVEFPEGNPIQQGRLGSLLCPWEHRYLFFYSMP
jgi:hypothetical protein